MVGKIAELRLGELLGYCAIVVAVLSTFLEVSKIKVNPWTRLAKFIGRAINGEVLEKVSMLETKVDKLESDVSDMRNEEDERNAKAARVRILHFGDELLHNPEQRHSKEHFDEILQSITEYNQYCADHPNFKNNMTEATAKHILRTYQKCLEKHSFLSYNN